MKVGSVEQHEVFEGETVGLVLAMELVKEVSIYSDNQAAITTMGLDAPGSA